MNNYYFKYIKYKKKYLNLFEDYKKFGGMAEINIENGIINTFLFKIYKSNDWDNLLEKIRKDKITIPEKINLLKNEYGDIIQIINDVNNENKINEFEAKNILKKIEYELVNNYNIDYEEIENIKKISLSKQNENKYFAEINNEISNKHNNTNIELLKNNDEINQLINKERGNYSENIISEKQYFKLSIVDNDFSITYNTKDLQAYNKQFIDAITKILKYKPNQINYDIASNEYVNKYFIEQILMYVPFDIIKENTIWELKSLNDTNKNFNELQISKLKGYTVNNISIGKYISNGIINYKFEFTNDFKKIKNVIFTLTAQKIKNFDMDNNIIYDNEKINIKVPILKENDNGYNYYWYMSNSSGDLYFNPLTNTQIKNNFIEILNNNKINLDKINDHEQLIDLLSNTNLDIELIDEITDKFDHYFEKKELYHYNIKKRTNKKTQKEEEYIKVPKKFSIRLPSSYTDMYSQFIKKIDKISENLLFNERIKHNYYN